MMRGLLLFAVAGFGLVACGVSNPVPTSTDTATPVVAGSRAAPTDYARELDRVTQRIDRLHKKATDEDSTIVPTKLATALLKRTALTHSYADYDEIDRLLSTALARTPNFVPFLMLRAYVDAELHRFRQATATLDLLAKAPYVSPSTERGIRLLRADIALECGNEATAGLGYRTALANERSWETLARRAHFLAKTGHTDEADALYAEARELVTSREMRAYAWLELQRGILDLENDRPALALDHFRRADSEYSGYPLIREHVAEALAKTGATDAAIAIYREVIQQTGDPEYMDALAAILKGVNPTEAQKWRVRARAEHEKRVARFREAGIGHFVEHLLADPADAERAFALARENYQLRPGRDAQALLSRATSQLQMVEFMRNRLQALSSLVKTAY
jgi:tetratricopeptide (TPR) repeat protein